MIKVKAKIGEDGLFGSMKDCLFVIRVSVFVLIAVSLASCSSSSLNGTEMNQMKFVSKKANNPDLIPPIYWGQTRHWLQHIELTMPITQGDGQPIEATFMAQVERSKLSEIMVGSSVEGWVLFQTIWDGKSQNLSVKPSVPESIDPVVLLSDMQMALWPSKILGAWYGKHPSMSIVFDERKRTIFKHQEPWVTIQYSALPCETGCTFELTNHHFAYRLKISNLVAQES